MLTTAYNTGILCMSAVMRAPGWVGAVKDGSLCAVTVNLRQPYLRKEGEGEGEKERESKVRRNSNGIIRSRNHPSPFYLQKSHKNITGITDENLARIIHVLGAMLW